MEVCVPLLQKLSGISNKMFTQTVRELEKDLFLEKFSGFKSRIQLSERGRSLEIFCEAWMLG
jgi:DNA-binding HxlR family transcriptional regulator